MTSTLTIAQKPKRITLATIKSFVRKNREGLYINVKESFDGMIDGCKSLHDGFVKAESIKTDGKPFYIERMQEATLGIEGAWFVGDSRDRFTEYEDSTYKGYRVYNCCGNFILAVCK